MVNTAQIEERSEVILGVQDHRYHHPHLCVCVCEARNVQKVLEALTVPNLFEIIIFVQPICLFASKMVKAVQFWPQKLDTQILGPEDPGLVQPGCRTTDQKIPNLG